jgi:putative N-acetyltransferase (TIGR04045 family)
MPRPEILCRSVAGPDEAAIHHWIRHEVFVLEQTVFAASDLDAHDAADTTIKVLAWTAAPITGWEPGGAVRLYPLGGGDGSGAVWQGDRLAVLLPFRAWNLGAPLVRFAVDTAASLGGVEMVAHVQTANVRFFERLGWRQRGQPEIYVGLPHQLMAIDLTLATRRHRSEPAGRSSAPVPVTAQGRAPLLP